MSGAYYTKKHPTSLFTVAFAAITLAGSTVAFEAGLFSPLSNPINSKISVSPKFQSQQKQSSIQPNRGGISSISNVRSPTLQTTTTTSLRMSANTESMRANLAVALDKPVFPFTIQEKVVKKPSTSILSPSVWQTILTVLVSDAFKTAVVAFILAFGLSIIARSPTSASSQSILQNIKDYYKLGKGRLMRLLETLKAKFTEKLTESKTAGVAMTFEGDGGWGVSSFMSKKRILDSSYVQYDFQLPEKDNTLALTLGQKLELCCLDNDDNVVQGSFYLFSKRDKLGSFSLVAPSLSLGQNRVDYEMGKPQADFARVLDTELGAGDEIAIRPGNNTLSYRGKYLPVTDMIYVASGMGIVPILHQIKAVLPKGSSSVKMVTVIWINGNTNDFDFAFKQLEEEYFKYSTKLEVSCIVDGVVDSERVSPSLFKSNLEIEDAIPIFRPGTMAVVSGPQKFVQSASVYLQQKDYPEDCLCLLD